MEHGGDVGGAGGGRSCPVVVGRDHELAVLDGAVEAARAGTGGVVVVAGEAGIGKTRLATETSAAAARRGMRVLVGRAVEEAAPSPFRAVTEALLQGLRESGPPEDPRLEPFRSALGRILPDWRSDAAPAGEESPVIIGEAVVRLLAALAGPTGCLLVLEDLHWADPDTLAVVEYLADNLARQPVLVVATIRSDEPGPAMASARTLLSRRAIAMIEPGRLNPEQVQEMAAAWLGGDSERAIALAQRSEGVPFLVEELLAAASEGARAGEGDAVPVSFAQTVERRLARLDSPARQVVEAAAVLGRDFDWDVARRVAGVASDQALAGLGQALHLGLLVAGTGPGPAGRFRFRHALTRDAVAAQLLSPVRAALARRAADVVESEGGGDLELAAELWLAAGDQSAAARRMLAGGRQAIARGALYTAEAVLRRARALAEAEAEPDRQRDLVVELELVLVEVLSLAARVDDALEEGEGVLARLGESGDPRKAHVHLLLARAADNATRWPLARHHLDEAMRLAARAGDLPLVARAQSLAAHVAMGEDRYDDAVALALGALEEAEGQDLPEVACEALEVIGRRERRRDLRSSAAMFQRALDTAERHHLELWRMRGLHELGTVDMLARSDAVRLEQARDLAYRTGALSVAATVELQLVGLWGFLFEPDKGVEAARRCVDLARSLRLDQVLVEGLVQSAFVLAIAGRSAEMDEALDEAEALGAGRPEVKALAWGHVRALYSLLGDETDEALYRLDLAMGWVRRCPAMPPGVFPALWALVTTAKDRDAETARAEVDRPEVRSVPVSAALLDIADAVALGRAGRGAEATAALSAGEELLRLKRMDGMRNLALRLAAEPAILDGWGEPVAWLEEARDYFLVRGHQAVVRACRSLLARAGVAPTRSRVGPFGTTDREAEVLVLVGERLSNREIGERLYISERTVEKHVQHLLAKTGATSRAQLVRLAHSGRAEVT